MDQLTDALHDLDPPHPPSRVDLDAVVRRAHRHRARARALTVAAVVVVAAMVAVPFARPGHHGDGVAARPAAVCEPSAPRPGTEREAAAARLRTVTGARLTMALDGPLRRALPGATLLDAVTCEPEFRFRPDGEGFVLGIVAVDAAGAGRVDVRLDRSTAPAGRDCGAGIGVTTCEWRPDADGTLTVRSSADLGDGVLWYEVDVYRPDGVHVHLAADNAAAGGRGPMTRATAPLDSEALLDLSRIGGLTL